MASYSENGLISYTVAEAVTRGTILKFAGNTDADGAPIVTPTEANNDTAIGVALTDANANEKVAVKILGSGGTILVKAGAAGLTPGDMVNTRGEAGNACSGMYIGIALGAGSEGDLVEISHRTPTQGQ